ncbi:MAG: SulP family inorganic anion transporter [Spirochaetia bacterium]|nr:SulP family inorganic anion transporter [Spirochaetia bacterium]
MIHIPLIPILRQEFKGYNLSTLRSDTVSGLIVALVALPLALAFSIASGVPPSSGMITAIFAGIFIGFLGGSSFQISGPTGAMAAILLPISYVYGLEGVFVAGFLSGIFLTIAAIFKMGKIVTIIPSAVVTGFTSGIAVVIIGGQIDTIFGVHSEGLTLLERFISYGRLGFPINYTSFLTTIILILIMFIWPKKWGKKIPGSMIVLILALLASSVFKIPLTLVGEIPQSLLLPFRLKISSIDLTLISKILPSALSIAALGMVETLLCLVSGEVMKNEKSNVGQELYAQGIVNTLLPFLGGIPSTAAIARTSVAISNGGITRLTSIIHGVVLLFIVLFLAPLMSKVPLVALSSILVVTAIRMNDWTSIKEMFSHKSKTSIAQFVITLSTTVVFDLTIAILLGVSFSILMFFLKSSKITYSYTPIDTKGVEGHIIDKEHSNAQVMYISGPLFFGTRVAFEDALAEFDTKGPLIISLRGVPLIDYSTIIALQTAITSFKKKKVKVFLCALQPDVLELCERFNLIETLTTKKVYTNVIEAIDALQNMSLSSKSK